MKHVKQVERLSGEGGYLRLSDFLFACHAPLAEIKRYSNAVQYLLSRGKINAIAKPGRQRAMVRYDREETTLVSMMVVLHGKGYAWSTAHAIAYSRLNKKSDRQERLF
jgi:hypothetical protein